MCLALGIGLLTSLPSSAELPPASGRRVESAASVDGSAKAKFAEALGLYRAGDFRGALPAFTEIVDTTRSPNARLYVGHCLTQLGRTAEAYRAFALTVKEIVDHPADKYETTREAAQAQLAILEVRVAKVVLVVPEVPPGFAMSLDGTSVAEKDFGSTIVIEPGVHRIVASATGYESTVRAASAPSGCVCSRQKGNR